MLSSFDKLLQDLAGLDGFELEIYKNENLEGQKLKKKSKNGLKEKKDEFSEETDAESSCDLEDLKDVKFDFDRFLEKNSLNVCEGDYALAKMSTSEYKKILEEQKKEEKLRFRNDIIMDITGNKAYIQEMQYRTQVGSEDRIKSRCKLFHNEALYRIFESNLRKNAESDQVIADKLKEMWPLITAKSLPLLYEGIRDNMKDLLEMTSGIMMEMKSIYRRARKPFRLLDVKLDLIRIRKLKNNSPTMTLNQLKHTFTHKNEYETLQCTDAVILEARKRLGFIHYGPSAEFAQVINATDLDFVDEEIAEDERNAPVSKRQLNKIKKALKEALERTRKTQIGASSNSDADYHECLNSET